MPITVTQGFTTLENVRKDISDMTESQKLEIANFVDQLFYETWYGVDPDNFATDSTISITSGTASYSLPSTLETYSLDGLGFFLLDDNGDVSQKLVKTTFGSRKLGYYLSGSNAVFTPTPAKTDTVTFRHIPERTEITALSDTFQLPNGVRFKQLLRDSLLVAFDVFDEDAGLEGIDDMRFANTLDRFIDLLPRAPLVSTGYDTSSSY